MPLPASFPKLYTDLAAWWPLLSTPVDYAEEAAFYRKLLTARAALPHNTMLELGSGGGNNAVHLKAHFQMTLVDIAPGMLAVSRELNPECRHFEGDMRTVRLDEQFDMVFIHDAISYMTTLADLNQAIETSYRHCKPGGAALFAPDSLRETFKPGTKQGGHDHGDRGLRYLHWDFDPDPTDTTYESHFAYLLRSPDGSIQHAYDQHTLGLFSRAQWLEAIQTAGFTAEAVPFEHSEVEPGSTEVFLGIK